MKRFARKLLSLLLMASVALVGILITPPAAHAAIATNGAAIEGCITTGSPLTLASWTPAADDLILLQVTQRDELIGISVTGNGLTWTEIANVDNAQGQNGVSLWRASGASPTTGSVVVTVTGATTPTTAIAQRFSAVDVGSANQGVEATATNAGPPVTDDADMLQAVTTVTADAWAVAAGSTRSGAAFTVPTGETDLLNQTVDCGTAGNRIRAHMWYEGPVATPASTQLGATADLSIAADWCMIVVSLKPSGDAAPIPPLRRIIITARSGKAFDAGKAQR